MTHGELVTRAKGWLRRSAVVASFPYRGFPILPIGSNWQRVRCGVVLAEASGAGIEVPDAIGFFAQGAKTIVIECKATRADFLADRAKFARQAAKRIGDEFALGNYRYYLTPPGVIHDAETPPGWGILTCDGRRVLVAQIAAELKSAEMRERAVLWSALRKVQESQHGRKDQRRGAAIGG